MSHRKDWDEDTGHTTARARDRDYDNAGDGDVDRILGKMGRSG
jgi:hypothetical protein